MTIAFQSLNGNEIKNYNNAEEVHFGTWIRYDKQHLLVEKDRKIQLRRFNHEMNEYTVYYQSFKDRMVNMYVIEYLQSIAVQHSSISMNAQVVGGMPTIKGTRIPVSVILACFRDGMTIDEICEDYNLSYQKVRDSLLFAIEVLDKPFHQE